MTRPANATLALLPLRLFFGATFLYAGLDKLLDPAFLDPAAPMSLHAQLAAFARFSPLGPLITATLPFSVAIGSLVAVAEIGVGVGALTGLAFRVAALGGMALSLLFWLTASWATHPYYFGADIPYAFGWLALAIGGHSGYLAPGRSVGGPREATLNGKVPGGPRRAHDLAPSPERRVMLQTAALAGIAALVASLTLPLRALGLLAGPGTGPSPAPTPGPTPLPTPQATFPPGAVAVASVGDVSSTGSVAFTVPFDAPAPLPAGDPAVIVQLADGSFVAFDAVCTHGACTVEWDAADRLLVCPCHDAIFDAEHGAVVLAGPAPAPLASLPIVIDTATGRILLVPSS